MTKVKGVHYALSHNLLKCSCEVSSIDDALGRVLCSAVYSPISHPPFDKSAMDGWAYYADELIFPRTLTPISDTIKAGDIFPSAIRPGECARIMTGAKIPEGCNAVHRLEYGEETQGRVCLNRKEPSRNIITQGQNLQKGDELLPAKILSSKDIAVLAASGVSSVPVYAPPKIAVISTGNEISLAAESCLEGHIFESNGRYLASALHSLAIDAVFLGVVPDNEAELINFLASSIAPYDIIIISGGVSRGDFDFVPKALEKIQVTTHVHGVCLKPGKPFYFGTGQDKAFFGLPGNPVSVFVCFELFVKPYIYQCMGLSNISKEYMLPLAADYSRGSAEREEYVPAQLKQGEKGLEISPNPYKGSSMVTVLPSTEALLCIPEGINTLNKGESVHVRLL